MESDLTIRANGFNLRNRLFLIKNSRFFNALVNINIIVYCLILGLESNIGEAGGRQFTLKTLATLDHLITTFFIFEISIKIISEKHYKNFFRDPWNIFDFAIILISAIPVAVAENFLSLRLLRIARALRLVTANSKLKRLISILYSALPSIGNIVLLIFIVTYIYAIFGNYLFSEAASGKWSTVPVSMLTLFQVMTGDGWASDVMVEILDSHSLAWLFFVSFIFINTFITLNLFVAVIIDEINEIKDVSINKFGQSGELHQVETLKLIQNLTKEIELLRQEVKESNRS